MKKIFVVLSAFLLPTISFAQGYMMNYFNKGGGCNEFVWGGPLLGMFLFLPLLGIVFSICVFIFWLLMLIDAIKHAPEKTKLIWVIVIIFTQIIGALVYYFMEKRPKNKDKTAHTEHKKEEVK